MPLLNSPGLPNHLHRDTSVGLSSDRGSSVHWGQKGAPLGGRSASVASSSVDNASSWSGGRQGPVAVKRFASMSATLPELDLDSDTRSERLPQDSAWLGASLATSVRSTQVHDHLDMENSIDGERDVYPRADSQSTSRSDVQQPSVSLMSSAIPNGPLASVSQDKSVPGDDRLPSLRKDFSELKNQIIACKEKYSASLEKAEAAGVYPAKRAFWKKLGSVVAHVGVAALFTGLALTTGGLGNLVVVGIAAGWIAKTSLDAVCAYRDMKNKMAEAQGLPLPYPKQPLGGDAIGNALFRRFLSTAMAGKSALSPSELDAVKVRAQKWSLGIHLGLAVVSCSAGGVGSLITGAAVPMHLACVGLSLGALSMSVALMREDNKTRTYDHNYALSTLPAHYEKLCDSYQRIAQHEGVSKLDDLKRQQLTDELQAAYQSLSDDLVSLEVAMQDKLEANANSAAEGRKAVVGGQSDAAFEVGIEAIKRTLENVASIGLESAGVNADGMATIAFSIKSMLSIFRMVGRIEQRTEPLVRHADQIVNLNGRVGAWVSV
jgi:hypothetical protein